MNFGKATGMRPLLLLDDIFDKLDADRVERIMEIVEDPAFRPDLHHRHQPHPSSTR